MIDVYDNIKTIYNRAGNNINAEDVKRYIEKGFIDMDNVVKCHNGLITKIFNETKRKCDIKDFDIWYTGGGSDEMKETIGKDKNFMTKPLFTNVLGNKKIADIKWSE